MKNIFKSLKETESEIISGLRFSPWLLPPPLTVEEGFRERTIKDINFLHKEGKTDLAALEAKKLIEHLQNEFNLG